MCNCGGPKLTLGVNLDYFLTYFFTRSSSAELRSCQLATIAIQLYPRISLLCLLSAGITDGSHICPAFPAGSGNPDSGPHMCSVYNELTFNYHSSWCLISPLHLMACRIDSRSPFLQFYAMLTKKKSKTGLFCVLKTKKELDL